MTAKLTYENPAPGAGEQPLTDSHPGNWLLMLDIDGTLLDIARRPDAVSVPVSLKETLVRLHDILSGALVLVSGRSIRDIDLLFSPLRLPVVGLHGGEMRLTGDRIQRQGGAYAEQIHEIIEKCRGFSQEFPGVLIEPKSLSVALHYRQNSEAGPLISARAAALVRELGDEWMLLRGKKVCEIKPACFDKGTVVRKLCENRIFAGRKPVYAGDDITDEDAFQVVRELSGYAIRIGGDRRESEQWLETPMHLRRWLAELADRVPNHLEMQPLRKPGPRRNPRLVKKRRIVVISNRISLPRASKSNSGGLAVAMSAVLQEHGGVWLGWSGKTNERPEVHTQQQGGVTYITRDISREEYEQFYLQFCNATLWPLLHYNIGLSDFIRPAYDAYLEVNRQYAQLLKDTLQPDDCLWVHDFHFIPLAHFLRELGVTNRIGFFLHTPFPSREVLLTLPVHRELMQQLLAFDVVGFQTARDLEAFRDYADSQNLWLQAQRDDARAEMVVSNFPISIQTEKFAQLSRKAVNAQEAQELKASLEDRQLILGVDRMDYSKGILHRMKAVEELLSRDEKWRKQFTFLQITPPTREEIQQYAQLRSEVESLVGHVNGKHAAFDWVPIRFMARGVRRDLLAAFYRLARVCLVTPLRDGMNLVAKEFVAAQDPEDPGVLVLSRFAGAAEEFTQALLVNPYDTEEMADAIEQALAMPKIERQQRWHAMHDTLSRQTLEKWYQDYLDALTGY